VQPFENAAGGRGLHREKDPGASGVRLSPLFRVDINEPAARFTGEVEWVILDRVGSTIELGSLPIGEPAALLLEGRISNVAKRPRFSRWRRLPGVFRTGENRPTDSGTDLDRIILYVPARILDLAETLADKAGVPTVQDYCALLLMQALENERVQRKVSDFEARRGPLEGLKQIANDIHYLAEWQTQSGTRPEAPSPDRAGNRDPAGKSPPVVNEPITVDIALADSDVRSLESAPKNDGLDFAEEEETRDQPRSIVIEPFAEVIPFVSLDPTVVKMTESAAVDVVSRHAGSGDDPWGFLPCLRRGEPVQAVQAAELIYALNQLEGELKGADTIERRTAHHLYRLALESQVLLTDAWPGVFDDRVITAIRTVQEAVERILSGQDFRYYPAQESSGSEQTT
jgi:hypothetical protein